MMRTWPFELAESDRCRFETIGNDHLPPQLDRIAAKYVRTESGVADEFELDHVPEPDAELCASLSKDGVMRIGVYAMVRVLHGDELRWPTWQLIHAESSIVHASAVVDALKPRVRRATSIEFMTVTADEIGLAECLQLESGLAALRKAAGTPTRLSFAKTRTEAEVVCREAMELSSHLGTVLGSAEGEPVERVEVVANQSKGTAYEIAHGSTGIHWLRPILERSRNATLLELASPPSDGAVSASQVSGIGDPADLDRMVEAWERVAASGMPLRGWKALAVAAGKELDRAFRERITKEMASGRTPVTRDGRTPVADEGQFVAWIAGIAERVRTRNEADDARRKDIAGMAVRGDNSLQDEGMRTIDKRRSEGRIDAT